MSEPTVPGVEPESTTPPAENPAEPTSAPSEGEAKVAPGTPGYSTYTGPPFDDNPTKLPEPGPGPSEPAVGEG